MANDLLPPSLQWIAEPMTDVTNNAATSYKFLTTQVAAIVWCLTYALPILHLLRIAVKDYHAWRSLGPGGLPSNPYGYLKLCMLRLRALNKRQVLQPPSESVEKTPYFNFDRSLPPRRDRRPQIIGIVPQRQINQRASKEDIQALRDMLQCYANEHRHALFIGKSLLEKHSPGLLLTAKDHHQKKLVKEITHVHGNCGSMHLTLHHKDVATVIDSQWGERHPLAGITCPEGFTLIYSPPSRKDFETVKQIVNAAIWHACDTIAE